MWFWRIYCTFLWSDSLNSLAVFLEIAHSLAELLLTLLWRGFCRESHTFSPAVQKFNNLNSLSGPTVVWFLFGKAEPSWHAAWVGIAFSFITEAGGIKKKGKIWSECFMRRRERDLGLASCAYWADNQSYRTTGSVQQEQESSPLSTETRSKHESSKSSLDK